MKVKRSETSDGKIELQITASAAKVQDAIKFINFQLALQSGVNPQDHQAPESLAAAVKEKVGEDRYNSFVDSQVMQFLAPFAITQEKLAIIGNPTVTTSGVTVSPDKELEFTVVVIPKPSYEIEDFSPVKIRVPRAKIDEAEIDQQLAMLAENRSIPAVTDEWVAENIPGVSTVPELREEIRKQGLAYRERELTGMKTFLAASEFAKRLTATIPDELYELTRDGIVQSLQQNLRAQGKTIQDFINEQGGGEQQFSMQLMMQTREVLTQGLSLDALARHLKMEVSDEDIKEAFRSIAPGHEKEARMEFELTGRMYQINEGTLRSKANGWLVETAEIEYVD
jgi:FKBP-type peptidyl-prolyl cis-trans isomerase (trigger factor)